VLSLPHYSPLLPHCSLLLPHCSPLAPSLLPFAPFLLSLLPLPLPNVPAQSGHGPVHGLKRKRMTPGSGSPCHTEAPKYGHEDWPRSEVSMKRTQKYHVTYQKVCGMVSHARWSPYARCHRSTNSYYMTPHYLRYNRKFVLMCNFLNQ
jgi:hypothetical protein